MALFDITQPLQFLYKIGESVQTMHSAIVDEDISAERVVDSGLICLVSVLRLHGIATDIATLRQRSGLSLGCVSQAEIVRQARRHGLKARAVAGHEWEDLPGTPLPAIGLRTEQDYQGGEKTAKLYCKHCRQEDLDATAPMA